MHAGVDPRPAQNTRGSFSTPMSPSTSSTMATTSKSSASGLANTHMHATHSHTTSNIETRDCGRKRKVQNTGWDPDPQQEHPQVHQHGTSVTIDSPGQDEPTGEDSKRIKLAAATAGEKRLRRFRKEEPASFAAVYHRATTQRFFVLSRTRCGTSHCPEMHLEVSGSTGNIYNVCIARQPTCDCPHARAGNQCKHIIFVLNKVLRAKHHYVYQLALLSDELRDMFANCPPDPADEQSAAAIDKNRKPVDGDCPICFEIMASGPGNEALVWCKAACGQNIHRQCFDMWAATKRQSYGTSGITCPYCRSTWETDDTDPEPADLASITRGTANREGYVNVADQLGISTQRDYSTYSRWWPRYPRYRRRR